MSQSSSGIAGDAVGAGADVAAAVLLVPFRSGEFGDVDVVAHQDVLQHRAVVDDLVPYDASVLQVCLAIGFAQLPLGEMIGEAERHVAALAGKHVEQETMTLRTAGDVLEHHARAVLRPQHRLGGEADILLAARALDGADLAQALGHDEPFAQIVVGDGAGKVPLIDHADSLMYKDCGDNLGWTLELDAPIDGRRAARGRKLLRPPVLRSDFTEPSMQVG